MLKAALRKAVEWAPKPLLHAVPPRLRDRVNRALGRTPHAPPCPRRPPPAVHAPTPAPPQLPPEVAAIRWFHQIDLGDGIITPGVDDSPMKLNHLHLPERLDGKSVLDIGTWDGYFAFAAERRGARRVLATDSYVWSGATWGSKAGFDLAKRRLGSHVEERHIDVMELSPGTVGVFDIVLCLGIIYHMRDPLEAMRRMASVTGELMVVESEVLMSDEDAPLFYFLPGYKGDASNVYIPTARGLVALLHAAGLPRVEFVSQRVGDYPRSARLFLHAWKH